jgi:hypothetical protein
LHGGIHEERGSQTFSVQKRIATVEQTSLNREKHQMCFDFCFFLLVDKCGLTSIEVAKPLGDILVSWKLVSRSLPSMLCIWSEH